MFLWNKLSDKLSGNLNSYNIHWVLQLLTSNQLEELLQQTEYINIKLTEIDEAGFGAELYDQLCLWESRFEAIIKEIKSRRSTDEAPHHNQCMATTSRLFSCQKNPIKRFANDYYNLCFCRIHANILESGRPVRCYRSSIMINQPIEIKGY